MLAGQFFQDRAQDLARPAPLGPEVDQHRNRVATLDDVLFEIVGIVGQPSLSLKQCPLDSGQPTADGWTTPWLEKS